MKEKQVRERKAILLGCGVILLLLGAALLLLCCIRAPQSDPAQLVPLSVLHRSDAIGYDSRWVGLLTISEHKGEGRLENGVMEIRGYIGRDEKGSFFELYHRDDPDTARPILTLGVRIDYKTLRPVIGYQDAAYFYIWLDARDVEPFTLTLENGCFSQRYFYDDGTETCWIEFQIKPEKRA